jgi:hypothetical protein
MVRGPEIRDEEIAPESEDGYPRQNESQVEEYNPPWLGRTVEHYSTCVRRQGEWWNGEW